jgi:hypothetical protein
VRGHHLLKTDNLLTEMLKQCDQDVRKEELAALLSAAIDRDGAKIDEKTGAGKSQKTSTIEGSKKPDAIAAGEERAHPLGGGESREVPSPVEQELPAWFDADAILAVIKSMINKLEEAPGGTRWAAISTTQGVVYAHPDGLWKAIKEVSGNAPSILAADADEGAKRNLLYTVVWELSKVKDAIATEYVAAKYYTTQATVVTGAGKGFTALLVPFRVQAFDETDASLEETKSTRLRKMVREIRPKQVEVVTCVT